jgi:hypothetical protein
VARGNEGNLLQHAVEVALADKLLAGGARELHLVCTHSMAPFEPLVDDASLGSSARLRGRLRQAAASGPSDDHTPLVRAYRDLGATSERYPNTAALVEWVAQRHARGLRGTLLDIEPAVTSALTSRFPSLAVVTGDWRQHLDKLAPIDRAKGTAWLVTDPYKFVRGRRQSLGVIDQGDLTTLATIVHAHANTKRAGCLALFVYGMFKPERSAFYAGVATMLTPVGLPIGALTVAAGPKRHVALLIATDDALLRAAADQALSVLRGNGADRDPSQALPWNFFEHSAPPPSERPPPGLVV